MALYGTLGAGKTSIFRMLASLMQPDSGRIVLDGVAHFDLDKNIQRRPKNPDFGMVFENYALLPNISLREILNMRSAKANQKPLFENYWS